MNEDIFVLIEHVRGQVADITYTLLAQARHLTDNDGGQVIGLLLGSNAEALAHGLAADKIIYFDHPALAEFNGSAYHLTLFACLRDSNPRLVLMGDTTIGADLAGGLSVGLGLPLISCCRSIAAQGSELTFTSQICGGKLMAEGKIPAQTTLVTMLPGSFRPDQGQSQQTPELEEYAEVPSLENLPLQLITYHEPAGDDVDIRRAPLLVGVGRGIQREDNLEVVQELADALGAVVCATRPVVDQAWLPGTRLVGKSGKSIQPQVYLALGVSGAPEHSEAITGSKLIIAVNTDPAAPIFNLARYGATLDLLDLAPVLAEKIRAAKGVGVR